MGAGTTTTSAPTQPNAPTQPFSYNYLMMLLNSGGYTAKKDLSRPTQLKRGGEGFNYFKEVGQPVDFTTLTPTTPTTPTTTPTTDTPPPTTPPPTTPPPTTAPDPTPEPEPEPEPELTVEDIKDELNEIAGDIAGEDSIGDLATDDETFEDYLESDDYVQTTAGGGSTTMDDAAADPFDTSVMTGDDVPTMDELIADTSGGMLDEDPEDVVMTGDEVPTMDEAIADTTDDFVMTGDETPTMDEYLADLADQDARDRIKFEDLLDVQARSGEGLLSVREYNNLIQNRIKALDESTMTVSGEELEAERAEIKRLQGLTAQDALNEGYAAYVDLYNVYNQEYVLGENIFTLGDPADNPVSPVFTGNPADDFTGSTIITDGTSVYEGAMSKEQFEQELFNQQGEGSVEDQYGEYLRNYKEEKFGNNPIIISDGDGFRKPDRPATDTPATDTPATDTPPADTPATDTPPADTPAPDTLAPDAPTPENYGMDSEGNLMSYSDRFTYNPDRDYIEYASGEELSDYLLYKRNQSLNNTDLKPYEHFEYEQEDQYLVSSPDYKRHLEWSQNNNNMNEMRYLETTYYEFKTKALSSQYDEEYNKFLSMLNLSDSPILRNNFAAGKGMEAYSHLSEDLNTRIASSMFGSF